MIVECGMANDFIDFTIDILLTTGAGILIISIRTMNRFHKHLWSSSPKNRWIVLLISEPDWSVVHYK
jgi:hypothetical protein